MNGDTDTIYDYIGREAEWVALCGFNSVESSSEIFTEGDAADLVEFVWEFCEESCKAANVPIPPKHEAVARLAAMIVTWNAEHRSDDAEE
jgi:hypothetical protein